MSDEHDETATSTGGGGAEETVVSGADSDAHYEPVVQLKEVETVTGEENDNVLYKQRAALYRFDAGTSEWKERGRGDVRLLENKQSKRIRVLLRQEKTLKLCCNHIVLPDLSLAPNAGSDRSWTWRTQDYAADTPITETFAIRFNTSEIATAFKEQWDAARQQNSKHEAGESKHSESKTEEKKSSLWTDIISKGQFDKLSADEIKAVWTKYDKDQSQSIDNKELQSLLQDLFEAVFTHINVELTPELKETIKKDVPDYAKSLLVKLDSNKDGKISWDEFNKLNEVQLIAK